MKMALIRSTTKLQIREIFSSEAFKGLFRISPTPAVTEAVPFRFLMWHGISYHPALYAAVKKAPARMSKVQEFLLASNESSQATSRENTPKISLDHVIVGYAGSGGGSGGHHNANIVNTKFQMRFNVKNANWLSDRVKQRILQMERNRINKDGELVISSTKSPTLKGNFDNAMAKLQLFTRLLKKFQEIIDAACYVPPSASKETLEKITKLSEQKRSLLLGKKDLKQV